MPLPDGSTVLIADDSEADAFLTMEALRDGHPDLAVHHVRNGTDALAFLRRQPPFEAAPAVDLLLLDINMPGLNGHSVLCELRADDALTALPVVMLTTSSDAVDINNSYREHANAYLTKPLDFDTFLEKLQEFDAFWFHGAALPDGTTS